MSRTGRARLRLALLAVMIAAPAGAEAPGFRRVAAPPAGSAPRITVQIALLPERALPAVVTPEPAVEEVAPPAGPVAAPGLAGLLARVEARHGASVRAAAAGTRVPPPLALAVIAVESGGRSDVVSHAGAAGLMQLMPATARRFGVADRFAPGENIRGGVAYLDWLMGRFGGDVELALAAYNAGEGAVDRAGGIPPYAETRAYVPKVIAAWRAAAGCGPACAPAEAAAAPAEPLPPVRLRLADLRLRE